MALAPADSIASVGWDLNDQARRTHQVADGEYSVRHLPVRLLGMGV